MEDFQTIGKTPYSLAIKGRLLFEAFPMVPFSWDEQLEMKDNG